MDWQPDTQIDIEGSGDKARETELIADRYASSLLMPSSIFKPALASHKKLSWKVIREVAREFRCSPDVPPRLISGRL
jgi:Zn-dependent peptidase ImmA (M78 family)